MLCVTDVKTMRESDAKTIARGVLGRELMWRAGVGIFNSYSWKGKVAIVCGSGNNAGDGFVLAQLLHQKGIPCTIFLLSSSFSPDGRYYFDACCQLGIEICYDPYTIDFSPYCEIVDCIFGTGFRGEVSGIEAEVIKKINCSGKTVISVDINSGLNGDNGLSTLCVRSDLTVSIGFYQNGHFLAQAKDVIGRLVNIDVGIDLHGKCNYLLEENDCKAVLGKRLHNSHKGNYGYVSILGGCKAYSGAVKLANLSCAALRAGCGVVKLIVPESLAASVSPYLLESTLATLPDEDGYMSDTLERLDEALRGQSALAIGMGWGSAASYESILRHILENYSISLVIDADGLNTLSKMDRSILRNTRCNVILTPHPKEMERLSGIPAAQILANPIETAQKYAKENNVCVLLKGTCTVVADNTSTYLVNRGCPGMATAGSGDVLSGILVGLLGYAKADALTAACGAMIAGIAGELAEKKLNAVSMLASDTVEQIGNAITGILQ